MGFNRKVLGDNIVFGTGAMSLGTERPKYGTVCDADASDRMVLVKTGE